MESYYKFIDTTEKVLTPLGLMEGEWAIPKRWVFGAIVGTGIVALIKPESMFDNGAARPWSFLAGSEAKSGPKPTATPWLIAPLIGGIFFGMFI